MWFDTLRDALASESVEASEQWPVGVNIAYGEQVDVETDDYMITVYRDNEGRYQRPIIGYRAAYMDRTRVAQVTESKGVFVYWNLHKALWSVKSRTNGRVVAHESTLSLADAVLKVSKKGRERVISERRKNVHAGVVGKVRAALTGDSRKDLQRIRYNPYEVDSFVTLDGEPVLSARYVELRPNKTVWALL